MSVVPVPFLFRTAIPVLRIDALPRAQKPLLKLPASTRIPFPAELTGQVPFAELRMAWNPAGLALSVGVTGTHHLPDAHPAILEQSDGCRLWFDTRDTRANHRASRFCHLVHLLPNGGGRDGKSPCIVQLPVPRAAEDAPEMDLDAVLLESECSKSGWRVDAWIPAELLHGFDPLGLGRLGFYCHVRDKELGHAFFSVGEDFPFAGDPSLWSTLQLQSGQD